MLKEENKKPARAFQSFLRVKVVAGDK